ncbi:MAG TPA: sigma-70 family RNA polymerase sigma factor [Bryobacteraceae bacterium]|nr:sigma-70 family RNA polymerase sigma factor [Bryobacteraceae bacterium]
MAPDQQVVTRLLKQWGEGDKQALDQLMPLVYDQLRSLAGRCLASAGREQTLRATALVNEAYVRLVRADLTFNDRVHFFAVAARLLRHILVDHARGLHRQKRGAGAEKLTLDEAVLVSPETPSSILDLDEALSRLAELDKRKADVIELLFFGGLTYDEAAAALEVSPATVHRELRMAKAWLHKELATT